MRRSLRKMDTQEVKGYPEAEQLFTVRSLQEARQRLREQGLDPAAYCFYTWMREGVRYYRVWEDRRLKEGIVQPAAFGEVAARMKRAEAEKLYTVARRYVGTRLRFEQRGGLLQVCDGATGAVKVVLSLPVVGGALIFEGGEWSPEQAARFVNAILVRGLAPDLACDEAEGLVAAPK